MGHTWIQNLAQFMKWSEVADLISAGGHAPSRQHHIQDCRVCLPFRQQRATDHY